MNKEQSKRVYIILQIDKNTNDTYVVYASLLESKRNIIFEELTKTVKSAEFQKDFVDLDAIPMLLKEIIDE